MSILLWSEGAPLAHGDTTEDCPSITPYLVQANHPTACIVVCPGGGYHIRANHEGEPIAKWLNQLGISAVVLQYRVSPYQHPAPLLDAKRAIRLVRHHAQEWNIDPERVGILGFSAGGHLASTAGTHFDAGNPEATDPIERESCKPNCMILCYPVISMVSFTHIGSNQNLLGANPTEEARKLLSSELQVDAQTPPTFIWTTADDQAVPAENSLMFASALSKHQVPYELHVFKSGSHGLGMAEGIPEVNAWTSLCATWLKNLGY